MRHPLTAPPGSCLVVSYHFVRDTAGTRFEGVNAFSPADFTSQLDLLARTCDLLDYATFLGTVEGTRRLEQPSTLLTFDDGLVDHYATVFPALQAVGARGIFFVSPVGHTTWPHVLNVQKVQLLLARLGGERLLAEVQALAAHAGYRASVHVVDPIVYRYDAEADRRVKQLLNYELPYEIADGLLATLFERHIGPEKETVSELYLTEAMIREMSAAGMTIGFHTRRHRVLSRLEREAQRAEIADGVAWITGLTGQATVPFCYPHGHKHAYNDDTLAVVREAGYSIAFTAVRAMSRPAADPRFELPRYDARDVPGALVMLTDPAAAAWR